LVDAPTAPVSSTEIRRLVAAGRPIDGLVPSAVAAHIGAHRLYSAREGVQL
jgi:nicotinic acid mononucleotide adenylyltransferase